MHQPRTGMIGSSRVAVTRSASMAVYRTALRRGASPGCFRLHGLLVST